MALMHINRNPKPAELRWFGFLWWPLAGAVIAGMLWWRGVLPLPIAGGALAVWALLGVVAGLVPAAGRMLWIGWMTLVYPIGWTVSHAVLALSFYGVILPMGLMLRLLGKDLLGRVHDSKRDSYWEQPPRQESVERYFRQY